VSTFQAMDRWLAAIEADTSADPIEVKIIRDKPADIVNACWIGGVQTTDLSVCDATYPYFREPRTVAGDAPTIYTMKCQLKPLAGVPAACGLGIAVTNPPDQANDNLTEIRILSNRADLISGGDALVEIVLPEKAKARPDQVKVDVDGHDVTSAFAVRNDGR